MIDRKFSSVMSRKRIGALKPALLKYDVEPAEPLDRRPRSAAATDARSVTSTCTATRSPAGAVDLRRRPRRRAAPSQVGHDRHGAALGRQPARDGRPDAGPAAGHDDDPALDPSGHGRVSRPEVIARVPQTSTVRCRRRIRPDRVQDRGGQDEDALEVVLVDRVEAEEDRGVQRLLQQQRAEQRADEGAAAAEQAGAAEHDRGDARQRVARRPATGSPMPYWPISISAPRKTNSDGGHVAGDDRAVHVDADAARGLLVRADRPQPPAPAPAAQEQLHARRSPRRTSTKATGIGPIE